LHTVYKKSPRMLLGLPKQNSSKSANTSWIMPNSVSKSNISILSSAGANSPENQQITKNLKIQPKASTEPKKSMLNSRNNGNNMKAVTKINSRNVRNENISKKWETNTNYTMNNNIRSSQKIKEIVKTLKEQIITKENIVLKKIEEKENKLINVETKFQRLKLIIEKCLKK